MVHGSFSSGLGGNDAPGRMSGTLSPALKFCAPQTIWRSPVPSLTRQSESLSALGCLSRETTCATTMPSNAPEIFCTPSTSRPSMVSRSVNSSGDQLKSTYCLSQLRVTFIAKISAALHHKMRWDEIKLKLDQAVWRILTLPSTNAGL